MKFSLVMATLGRGEPVATFLRSLEAQGDVDVELVIADQNADDRVARVLAGYENGRRLRHLRCSPGLSRARNLGLAQVEGDVVAFPDDDCEYPAGLLSRIQAFFEGNGDYGGVAVRVASRQGQAIGRLLPRAGEVTPRTVWRQATAAGLFLRRDLITAIGGFDETLGLGAGTPWGSAEDIDYPLRALEAGYRLYYEPAAVVWHPDVRLTRSGDLGSRGYRYGAGWGRVRRKHKSEWWVVVYHLLRPIGGALLALLTGDIVILRFRLALFAGRLRGWLA